MVKNKNVFHCWALYKAVSLSQRSTEAKECRFVSNEVSVVSLNSSMSRVSIKEWSKKEPKGILNNLLTLQSEYNYRTKRVIKKIYFMR